VASAPDTEQQLRVLLAEQAALRRVAVLVARGAPQQEVFDAVSREVGERAASTPRSGRRSCGA
jgi:hypothetical protein